MKLVLICHCLCIKHVPGTSSRRTKKCWGSKDHMSTAYLEFSHLSEQLLSIVRNHLEGLRRFQRQSAWPHSSRNPRSGRRDDNPCVRGVCGSRDGCGGWSCTVNSLDKNAIRTTSSLGKLRTPTTHTRSLQNAIPARDAAAFRFQRTS